MTGVPLDADILDFGFVEKSFPNRGLPEHVVVHDRQVIRTLRTMLEREANPVLGGKSGNRVPERNQLGDELLERLVNRLPAALVDFSFDHCAGKPGDGLDADMRGNFDRSIKCRACELALLGVERIAVKRANRGYSHT